jgi:hypothetical protein
MLVIFKPTTTSQAPNQLAQSTAGFNKRDGQIGVIWMECTQLFVQQEANELYLCRLLRAGDVDILSRDGNNETFCEIFFDVVFKPTSKRVYLCDSSLC